MTKPVVPASVAGWEFHTEEISAGVYRVRGVNARGRSVEATGTDPEQLLAECKTYAASLGPQDSP